MKCGKDLDFNPTCADHKHQANTRQFQTIHQSETIALRIFFHSYFNIIYRLSRSYTERVFNIISPYFSDNNVSITDENRKYWVLD